MTNKDLFRLAKISLAARKKSTKSTVRGIAFGLILLIPVLYIAFGIFGDLDKKVNANPEILYMNLQTASARSGQIDSVSGDYFSKSDAVLASSHADNIVKNVKTDEIYEYEQIIAPFNPYLVDDSNGQNNGMGSSSYSQKAFEMTYGDGTVKNVYVYPYRSDNGSYNNNNDKAYNEGTLKVPFAAIVGENGKFAPKKITDKFGDIFERGGGFTDNGKGQVVLSETFLKSLSLTADDVVDKNFSVKYTDSYNSVSRSYIYIDDDAEPDNNDDKDPGDFNNVEREIYFCQNFKVVGVIKDDVTRYAMDTYGVDDGNYPQKIDHIMTNMMFFTSASVYGDDGEVLEPVVKNVEPESDDENENSYHSSFYVATYTQNQSEFDRQNKEYMAFGANGFNSLKFTLKNTDGNWVRNDPFSTRNVLVDATKFDRLDAAINTVKAEFSALLGDNTKSIVGFIAPPVYEQLSMVYNIFTYVVLAMSIMGGIIFFASMVNLFNSIVHSVDSRKSYLGVLRAVGAKRSLINKMYMAESLTIFKRALIWILIFATAICVGIMFLLNKVVFKYLNEMPIMPFKMSVSFVYIPVALVVALGVLLLLGFAFSYGCSWKVSRDPITETLAA